MKKQTKLVSGTLLASLLAMASVGTPRTSHAGIGFVAGASAPVMISAAVLSVLGTGGFFYFNHQAGFSGVIPTIGSAGFAASGLLMLGQDSASVELPDLDDESASAIGIVGAELTSYRADRANLNLVIEGMVDAASVANDKDAAQQLAAKEFEASAGQFSKETLSALAKICRTVK